MVKDWPVIEGAEPWSSAGEGDAARVGVLLVHGFTGNPHGVRPLAEAVAAAGYATEVIRLPGHGTHWRDLKRTRYADWYGAVAAARRDLRARCDRVVVIGFSMGGTLAVDLATQETGLAGVVVINGTFLTRKGLLARVAPLLAHILPVVPASAAGLVKNDTMKEGVDERAYDKVPTKAANSLLAALPGLRARMKGMTTPILAVVALGDRSVPPANTQAMPDLVGPAGDVTLVELPNSRHVAAWDLDAELLQTEVLRFIARVGGDAAG